MKDGDANGKQSNVDEIKLVPYVHTQMHLLILAKIAETRLESTTELLETENKVKLKGKAKPHVEHLQHNTEKRTRTCHKSRVCALKAHTSLVEIHTNISHRKAY